MSTKVKVLIAKVGLDGHNRGAVLLTTALRKEGFETFYSGLRRSPEEIAGMAVLHQVDCVGLSSLCGAHSVWFPKVTAALQTLSWQGQLVIAGGIIPVEDELELRKVGISAIFRPHHPIADIADYIRNHVKTATFPPARKIM